MKDCISHVAKWLTIAIFRWFPIHRKKIVFNAFNGDGWSCNPKYIAKEILRQKLPYDLVWLVKDMGVALPERIRKVKRHSVRACYELSTAHVIVNNVKTQLPFHKKRTQYYIQTWHGDLPMKYIEQEAEDKIDPFYLTQSKCESRYIDLILSASSLMTSVYRNAFWYDGEILEEGLPRNDVYFKETVSLGNKVRLYLNVQINAKVVLYAPTFRDNGQALPALDFQFVLQELSKKTGVPWVLVHRLHPNDRERLRFKADGKTIINGSNYPDSQELATGCDMLITDYSSMLYDFMLMGKPVLLYIPDLEEYSALRGLRPLYYQLPLPRFTNHDDFHHALSSVISENYLRNVNTFLSQTIRIFDKGVASLKVVNRIKQVIR